MENTFLGIRGVDKEEFRKFRAVALEKNMKLGEAITKAIKKYREELKNEKKGNPKNLLKIKGIIATKEKVKWSREIDDILYS